MTISGIPQNLRISTLRVTSITVSGLTATRVLFVTTNGLITDSASLTFNSGTGALTATSFVGNTAASTITGTTLAANVVTSSLTTVGALNSGSITSGFGSIDVGANSITGGALSVTGTGNFTGNVDVDGTIAVGGAVVSNYGIYINGNYSGNAARGFAEYGTKTATANSQLLYSAVLNNGTIATGTFTGLTYYGTRLATAVVTGTGTIATAYQFFIDPTPTATTRWGIYQAGTDANYFAGSLGSAGNVWAGNNGFSVLAGTTDGAYLKPDGAFVASANGTYNMLLRRRTSDGNVQQFYRDTTNVGSISVTTTATAYNTSSDARLKLNFRPITNSGTVIDALKPWLFDWITGEKDSYGFVAQEAFGVFPQAVTKGDDDATISQQWAMDASKFMPLVIAELQSLRARVAALEAK